MPHFLDKYVGKRVQILIDIDGLTSNKLIGIVKLARSSGTYFIKLDKKTEQAHYCGGLVKDGYGWWISRAVTKPEHIKVLGEFDPIQDKIKYLNERYNKHAESRNLPTKGILT